jgi:hypothetical protein
MATDDVKDYLVGFYEAVKSGAEISSHYDNWNKITEKYYKQSEWPSPETVSSWVKDGVSINSNTLVTISR